MLPYSITRSYVDVDPSLLNNQTFTYRVEIGNDISNDVALPAYFAP
ncbi:MAG: hypothetical protein ABI579_03925 [Candidatus Sumerlaeota bacterium]